MRSRAARYRRRHASHEERCVCGKLADSGHGDARTVYLSGGTAPPKPPPLPKVGLTEVERAISVLEGRHPEHEKIRRQTREAVERRARELEAELAKNARTRRRRAVAAVAVTAAIAAAVVFTWRLAQRTKALDSAITATEAPWLALGFSRLASNALTASHDLQTDLPSSSCFVATTTLEGSIRASVGGAAFEGPRSVAWCSCGPSHATIESPGASTLAGLVVLRTEASTQGGPLARSWVDFTPGGWGDTGRECADAMLDGWIAARRWPNPTLDTKWLDGNPSGPALRRSGFHVVNAVEASRPFGVVETTAGDCTFAVGPPEEPLSLRAPGGNWLISHARGAFVWCSSAPTTFTIWRDGTSAVSVLAAPAARIGGMLGARECAGEAGIRLAPEATWLRDDDLPWDAGCLLRASTLPDVTTSALRTEPEAADPRIVALALAHDANAGSEPAAGIACDPPLDRGLGPREAICAQTGPVAWFKKGDHAVGSARGATPFWLSSLGGHRETDAIARIAALLSLARRLVREGFEPTRFEGVAELARGVRITGRAGEDAVVAVGLSPRAPWALPYSDGVAWDLGGPPRVVALKAGDTVTLTSVLPPTLPLSDRRTVVFRHAASP
jgi:hypothetical protein